MIAATLTLAIPAVHAEEPAQPSQNGDRMFAMIDTNGDGKLDKAEVTRMMEMRAARKGDATMAQPEKIDGFIKRADANGDGAIDKAELAAMRKARSEAPQPAE